MSSDNIKQLVCKYFDEEKWHYEAEERDGELLITAGVGGFNGLYASYRFLLVVGDHEVQNFAQFPANARNAIASTAEFVARINSRLMYGAFLLDCDSGEIRFHQAFPAAAIMTQPQETLSFLVFSPVQMLDRFAKYFSAVITGLMSPQEAAVKALSTEQCTPKEG